MIHFELLIGGCPGYLGSSEVGCVNLAGKCYCVSSYTVFEFNQLQQDVQCISRHSLTSEQVDSWYTADSYCKSNSANLLSVETSPESVTINSYLGSLSLGK